MPRPTLTAERKAKRPVEDGPAIVFVHGLSGSAEGTWRDMARCIGDDRAFKGYTVDYYGFPTKLIRLPFSAPLPGLRGIADGLTTFLDERHHSRSEIYLVAHSLGGVIARQMIVSQLRSGRELKVAKLALIAVPNSGSMLANVGSLISFHHRQLKRLTKDDEGLLSLNADWEQLKVEEIVRVRYVVGGCDRVVPHSSAVPYVNRDNDKSLLIDADHRSIVKPKDCDDIRYTTIRRFLLKNSDDTKAVESGVREDRRVNLKGPDPLFDAYTPADAVYYVNRNIDSIVGEALGAGHIWLAGESGVGKTATLRRAAYENGWGLNHINLGGYEIADPLKLFHAMAHELASLAAHDEQLDPLADFGHCFSFMRRVLARFPSDKTIANVIEEMPISPDKLGDVANHAATFLEALMGDPSLHGRMAFAFSSLRTPETMGAKAREKIQVLNMGTWLGSETRRLVEMLAAVLKPELSHEDREWISTAANGSPRFVKQVFRKWRNGASGADLGQMLAAVRTEQI